LLRDAEAILTDAGFETTREGLEGSGIPWLLAENAFFAVGIVASGTLDEATKSEGFATPELLQRLDAVDVGGKRWDAYLVLLCEELTDSQGATRQMVELQQDTRGLRRLVATGVTDRGRVLEALRSFLPLPPPMPGGLSDASAALVDQLTLNGIEREKAEHYVTVFTETGGLDDA
jgi:hypothetical protein